jgi:hypothetical protein
MSIELSLAASRRTSWTRCESESVGSRLIAILYRPPDAAVHSAAALANDPDGSGNTYQVSVGGPELLDPPQPESKAPSVSPAVARAAKPRALSAPPTLVTFLTTLMNYPSGGCA